jgi:hypothetical protein
MAEANTALRVSCGIGAMIASGVPVMSLPPSMHCSAGRARFADAANPG